MNSPGILSHPCLQGALASRRLSSANRGIVVRNQPRSSSLSSPIPLCMLAGFMKFRNWL